MTRADFEQYLKVNSVQSPDNICYVDESPLNLPFDELKFVGKGIFNTVYKARIGNDSWIIKEGAYDLKFPLFKNVYLPLPRKAFDRLYKLFGVSLMPSHQSAIDQLQEYILLARYFGYYKNASEDGISGFDPEISAFQHEIRTQLKKSILEEDEFAELLLQSVKTFRNYHKIKELVLDDELLNYHFLPREHLVLSITASRKGALKLFSREIENHYIIQDCIEGDTLGTVEDEDLFQSKAALSKLIIFMLLATSMARYENKLIDSRPEGILSGDWFGQTGNIIVNPENGEVKFVDTRWLNKTDGNFLEKGIVVSDLITDALKWNLAKYVEAL